MKKIEFSENIGIFAMLFLYPILSFRMYRHCRTNRDDDAKMFARYGILGIIGILFIVVMWFTPMPWKFIPTIAAAIFYLRGAKLQTNLIGHRLKQKTTK